MKWKREKITGRRMQRGRRRNREKKGRWREVGKVKMKRNRETTLACLRGSERGSGEGKAQEGTATKAREGKRKRERKG